MVIPQTIIQKKLKPGLAVLPVAAAVNVVFIDCMFSSMAFQARPSRTFLAATEGSGQAKGCISLRIATHVEKLHACSLQAPVRYVRGMKVRHGSWAGCLWRIAVDKAFVASARSADHGLRNIAF